METNPNAIKIDNRPQYTFIRNIIPDVKRLFEEQKERMKAEKQIPSKEIEIKVCNKNNTLTITLHAPEKEAMWMDDRAADVLDYLTSRIIATSITPHDMLEIDLYHMLETLGFNKNKNSNGRECGYCMRDYVLLFNCVLAFTQISCIVERKVPNSKKSNHRKSKTTKEPPKDVPKISFFSYEGKVDREDANYGKKARLKDAKKVVIRSEESFYIRKMLLKPSEFFFSLMASKQTSQIPVELLRMNPQKRKAEKRIGKYLLQYQAKPTQTLQIAVIAKASRLNIVREKEFYNRFMLAIDRLIEIGIIKNFECPPPSEGRHWFSVWLESNAVITF